MKVSAMRIKLIIILTLYNRRYLINNANYTTNLYISYVQIMSTK